MNKKAILVLVISCFVFCFAKNHPAEKEKINWMNLTEAQQKVKTEDKPVLIDLFTDWCYWCKVMDKKTYSNEKVIRYINEHFYPVKLDAETKMELSWNGKKYFFDKDNKINNFALYVTDGQPGFPTTVIFPDVNKGPAPISGYMSVKEIEGILKYFGEGNYKKESFEKFSETFKNTW